MHITIFEEKDFKQWSVDKLQDHKESILKRACSLLACSINGRKEIKGFSEIEEILLSNLDSVKMIFETEENELKMYNTCLVDTYFSIEYTNELINAINESGSINSKIVKVFFSKISNFITDATIMEWKLFRKLPPSFVKVESQRLDEPAFFPVSYYLNDLIFFIESLTGKRVRFTNKKASHPVITKEDIICYFDFNRITTDYIIAEQLIEVYLYIKDFRTVDKFYFMNEKNWVFSEEELADAMHVVLQNRFTNLMISELYPVYKEQILHEQINFERCKDYMSATCKYFCAYSRKNSLCKDCSGVAEFVTHKQECPLYRDNSVLDKVFTLDELSNPYKQNTLAEELLKDFKL